MKGQRARWTMLSLAIIALLVVAGIGANTAPVSAALINPLAPAQTFNVFVQGNATLVSNETEGAVAIGGNVTMGGNYNVAFISGTTVNLGSPYGQVGLVVGGTVNWASSTGHVFVNGGNAVMASDPASQIVVINGAPTAYVSLSAPTNPVSDPQVRVQNGGVVQNGTPIDFTSAFATLRANSSALQLLSPTACPDSIAIITPGQNGLPLVQGKVNVWNTTLAQLNAIQNLNGSAPSSSAPLIINVTDAGSLNWSPGSYAALQNAVPAGASYVLWNFPNATSLNLTGGNALYGDLLAPNASVVDALGGANINGQVIAANFVHNGGGEVHYHPLAFSVDTACTDVVTTTTTDAATTTTTDAATTTTTDAATTTTTDAATTTTTDAATTTTTDAATTTTTDAATTTTTDAATTTTTNAATTTTTDAATTTTTDAATTTTTDAATTTTTDAATTTTGLSGAGGSNTSTTSANGISNTTRSAGALPATGTESPSVLPFAALIVIAGTGIVLVARRRRIS